MISLDRFGLSFIRGRTPVGHRGRQHQRQVQPKDHRNALDGNVLQKTPGSLWRKRKRATAPAVAPKLRQNPFKYRSTDRRATGLLVEPLAQASEPPRPQMGLQRDQKAEDSPTCYVDGKR